MGKATQVPAPSTYVVPQHIISDAEATVLDIYDWSAVHNAECTLFRYAEDNIVRNMSWREVNDATHRAAAIFSACLPVTTQCKDGRPVLAIFANCDSITYFCSILGAIRAGFTVFPVSPRNSPEAVAHLLAHTKTSVLFTNAESDVGLRDVVRLAFQLIRGGGHDAASPAVHTLPMFGDLFPACDSDKPAGSINPFRAWHSDDAMCIMHSSGSTSLPKPITWTVRQTMQFGLAPSFGEMDLNGSTIACHACPMFHTMGILHIGAAAVAGYVIAVFRPCRPAVFPTAETFIEEAQASGCDMIISVPAFLEKWSQDPKAVQKLKALKAVIFGSAPLLRDAGDTLASAGVHLYSIYGSTEAGLMTHFLPEANPGLEWQYLRFTKQIRHTFVPQNDGTYELVVMASDRWSPSVMNAVFNEQEGYATRDLFVPHPTKEGFWMFHGRADDQIVLSTGEKTNPVPFERILAQDPHIQTAVIFGHGKSQCGVVIQPFRGYEVDLHSTAEMERFKDAVWPTVERANAFGPTHSRIFWEMITLSKPSKPFTYTAKGTARRQAIIVDYEPEIVDIYARYEKSSSDSGASTRISLPTSWGEEDTLCFIRSVVQAALGRETADTLDVFQYGCDSLQATWISNQISNALRHTRVQHTEIYNCVYKASTIRLLTDHILGLIAASEGLPTPALRTQEHRLQILLQLYTRDFPVRPTVLLERSIGRDVVLLTGTTGGLGANILRHLLTDASVGVVYAFNRPSSSFDAQRTAFVRYGLDVSLLESPKMRFVRGDLKESCFGLEELSFAQMKASVTHIIHNAWKVDFNQSVNAYLDLLSGLRSLVDFALTSPYRDPPRLLFVSSHSVVPTGSELTGPAPEESIVDPIGVVPDSGYAESKWLGERILATSDLPNATTVRIGQLSGGENSYWNDKEWFPALVSSTQIVGCLPALEGEVSWLPVHTAALAITQMCTSPDANAVPVLHLAHPRSTPWSHLISAIAHGLDVPIVSYPDWLAALEKAATIDVATIRENAALLMLDFFRSASRKNTKNTACQGRDAMGIALLDLSKSQRIAAVLSCADVDLPCLNRASAEAWLQAWRASGYLRRTLLLDIWVLVAENQKASSRNNL